MPFDGNELYWHLTMCRFKALGPMGTWITLEGDGSTELVEQACVQRKPFWGDKFCKCGWAPNIITWEEYVST